MGTRTPLETFQNRIVLTVIDATILLAVWRKWSCLKVFPSPSVPNWLSSYQVQKPDLFVPVVVVKGECTPLSFLRNGNLRAVCMRGHLISVWLASLRIPRSNHPFPTDREESLSIWRILDMGDTRNVALQDEKDLSGLHVPQPQHHVVTRRSNLLAAE